MLAVQRMSRVAMVDDDRGQRLIDAGASHRLPRSLAPRAGRQPDRNGFRTRRQRLEALATAPGLEPRPISSVGLLSALGAPRSVRIIILAATADLGGRASSYQGGW
jgi:hypothetical protein